METGVFLRGVGSKEMHNGDADIVDLPHGFYTVRIALLGRFLTGAVVL